MSELEELRDRVRAASGPDRELDHALMALIGTWPPNGIHRDNDSYGYDGADGFQLYCIPHLFTGSIDGALALACGLLPGWAWLVRSGENQNFFANLHRANEKPNEGAPCWPATAATAPLAILAALLSALVENKSGSETSTNTP